MFYLAAKTVSLAAVLCMSTPHENFSQVPEVWRLGTFESGVPGCGPCMFLRLSQDSRGDTGWDVDHKVRSPDSTLAPETRNKTIQLFGEIVPLWCHDDRRLS
jgi:hypothetical protein